MCEKSWRFHMEISIFSGKFKFPLYFAIFNFKCLGNRHSFREIVVFRSQSEVFFTFLCTPGTSHFDKNQRKLAISKLDFDSRLILYISINWRTTRNCSNIKSTPPNVLYTQTSKTNEKSVWHFIKNWNALMCSLCV